MRLFDTTVGTFLGPPFDALASRAPKRWSEEGADSLTVVSRSLICCSHNTLICLHLLDAWSLTSIVLTSHL